MPGVGEASSQDWALGCFLLRTLARTLKAVAAFLGSFGLSVVDESNLRDAKSGTEAGVYGPVGLGRGSRFLPFPLVRITPALWLVLSISSLHLLGVMFSE